MPIVLERSKVRDHYKNAEFVGYFKLLRGSHSEGGVRYLKGDVVHSKADLEKKNQLPDSIKLMRVDGPQDADAFPIGHPATPGDPKNPVGAKKDNTAGFSREELSELTKDDLVSMALEEGHVFDTKTKKEDMISFLLGEGEKA